jgi:hypothetical protein
MALLDTLKTLVSLLYVFYIVFSIFQYRNRRGHDRMVDRFINNYVISDYHH